MCAHRLAFLSLFAVLLPGVTGCGSSGQPEASAESSEETGGRTWPLLKDLLQESRSQLAQRCDVLLQEIRTREKGRQAGEVKFTLLPDFRQPLVVPIFQEARFDAKLGLSVPPYFDKNNAVARIQLAQHLRRFGDLAGADLLAGQQPEGNTKATFPAEWSRLVGLQVYALQQRLATGDTEALTPLIDCHRQLKGILVESWAIGSIRNLLLPRGRSTLAQAAAVWRKQGQIALAEQADQALKEWQEVTDYNLASCLRSHRAQWAPWLGKPDDGRALLCPDPLLPLDLLQLPFTREAAEGAVLFFDAKDQLEAFLLTYTPRVAKTYDSARELADACGEWVRPEGNAQQTGCSYRWNGWTAETGLCPSGGPLGGWVRIVRNDVSITAPRHFALTDLDQTYERNRLKLAPFVLGERVVAVSEGPDSIPSPLPKGRLKDVTIMQSPGHDLLDEARYRFDPGTPIHLLALPLFAQHGIGVWSYVSGQEARPSLVSITWRGQTSSLALQLPSHAKESVQLILWDTRDKSKTAERLKAVAEKERSERQARLESGKPERKLPRKMEHLPLGLDRSEATRFLPQGQNIHKRSFADGVVATINTPPPQGQPSMLRQIILRFDDNQRLSWIQARYETVGGSNLDWPASMLEQWQSQGGLMPERPSPLVARSADLPLQSPLAVCYRWRDDITEATFCVDRNGVEITLRDLPPDDEPVPPLQFLPRGPESGFPGLHLGMPRSELQEDLGARPAATEDGAWAIRPERGPYDAILVHFKDDYVSSIAGRHRLQDAPVLAHRELEKALLQRWGSQIAQLSWPDRRDFSNQGALQCLTWFDDVTRFRLYWAESDSSPPRIWSEWRDDAAR